MEQLINSFKKWVLPEARPVRQSSVSDSLRVLDGTPSASVAHFLESGQLIVELLIAFGLASILIPAVILGFVSGLNGRVQGEQRLQASGYLREAEEAVRSARDTDWSNIATNGTYHPVAGSLAWTLSPGTETVGTYFTRSIVISDVNPVDPSRKQITINVSWSNILPTTLSSTLFLTRWKNLSSDLSVSGKLLNQGSGDWCAPTLSLAQLDLPKNGVANAVSAIQGQLAAGTGDNSSGVSYANVLITDPAAPTAPVPSIAGTYDGFKTNDVFTEKNYAYLATDNNFKEIDIINLNSLSGGKYAEAGYFNAPGNGNGSAVVTNNNVGYMLDGNKLYDFDLSTKTGSRPIIEQNGLTLPGTGTRLATYGNRLYATTNSTSAQLVIVDISNTSNMTIVKNVSLAGQGGKALYINSTGTRAYVATSTSAGQKNVFIVNTDETSSGFGTTVGSFDTNGMDPKGIVLVNIPRVIVVGTGGALQYQVIDVTDETAPVLCTEGGKTAGGLAIPTGVNGISTVFTTAQRAYSYIITGDASSELKIIEGGPGAGGAGGGLTVESPTLDASHSSVFNSISTVSLTPPNINVTYQVAVSKDCLTYNYSGNYTTSGGFIPFSVNPGQCFRYKATFSGSPGDVSATLRVIYSP